MKALAQIKPPHALKIWRIDDKDSAHLRMDTHTLAQAAVCLRAGGLVAFPTETVYGLGADARNAEAIARLFVAKGRPSDNPLIVHVSSVAEAECIVSQIQDVEQRLMALFWPGALTIVMPVRAGAVCPAVIAHGTRVAVRVPAHPVALELLRVAGIPIAAPSANRSGRPSPTCVQHVREDLNDRIDGIVDAGEAWMGIESTVVEVDGDQTVHVLRTGGITAEMLIAAGFTVAHTASPRHPVADMSTAPRAPGTKYKHYAPKGKLCVVEGAPRTVHRYIQKRVDDDATAGLRTAVLTFADQENIAAYRADMVIFLGPRGEVAPAAQRLYGALRACDSADIACIYAEATERTGMGAAYMDRLLRAASYDCVCI